MQIINFIEKKFFKPTKKQILLAFGLSILELPAIKASFWITQYLFNLFVLNGDNLQIDKLLGTYHLIETIVFFTVLKSIEMAHLCWEKRRETRDDTPLIGLMQVGKNIVEFFTKNISSNGGACIYSRYILSKGDPVCLISGNMVKAAVVLDYDLKTMFARVQFAKT